MPKYHVTITRTLTFKGDIEVENEQKANEAAGEWMEVLEDRDFEYDTAFQVKQAQPEQNESFVDRYNIARLRGEGGTN